LKIVEISSPRTSFGAALRLLRSRKKMVAVEALPEVSFVVPSVIIDADHLSQYCDICGFKESKDVPFIYPQILTFGLMLEFMGSEYCPWPAAGMVHMVNRIEQHNPLFIGDDLRIELSTGDLFRHEKGQMFNIKFQVLRGGHLVWQATQSTLCRVVKQPVGEQYRSVMHSETRLSRQASFSIPANIGRRYGKVSGDVNPIHLTNLTARAFGFKRAIAHGMWTKARALSALLPEGITERAMAEVEFKLPLYLPGTVSLWSNRSAKCAKFELRDRQGEKPHLRGQLRFS
jgi:acyl dehydratase